ncbi:MAG TPA: hypothetical protein VLV78_03630 [Thermoanaerobaculia bacterium]|nr:hypothetical protein [Thermoanaerobaculia bacterium]
MKNPLIYLTIAAVFASCRGGSGSLQRKDQQNYDVVQEGQASGVTSTINVPGEPTPPPVGLTGTNADTTSNFTLPQVATSTTTTNPPGTLAGTLPQATSGSAAIGYPRPSAPPRPRPTPPSQQPAPQLPATETTPPPLEGNPPPTVTVPPNTDTAPPPPTQTDTQAPPTTTTTSDV